MAGGDTSDLSERIPATKSSRLDRVRSFRRGAQMSDRTESELEKELEKYKGLAGAHGIASRPPLSGTYLADYLFFEPEWSDELMDADAALLCLHRRINDPRLLPILSKLFENRSLDKAVKAWDQALSECVRTF
jgi:hypothetical protein